MKRLWIGVIILVVLLGAGIGTTVFAVRTQSSISEKLAKASEAALRGEWKTARLLALDAQEKWESLRHGTAAIADHEPMEEIDDLFSQMEIYLLTRQQIPFAACCASLSVLTNAIGESHAVNWWSLL